jgi:hypothetical protein
MTKKPQGWNSVVQLGSAEPFSPIVLPDDKSEREALIVQWFWSSLKANHISALQFHKAIQNSEDDFDFEIQTSSGTEILELTEFAPLSDRGGFANAADTLNVGATVDALTNAIMRKADHYAHKPRGLNLLVYVTHYAFQPIEDVFRLVEDRLWRLQPFFERVFFMIPNSAIGSELYILYPTSSPRLTSEEIKKMRGRWFANGDLSREAWVSKD